MKKLMFALVFVMLFAGLYAQAPQGITHQAVIRNAANELLANQTIGIQVSILQGSAEGTAVYVETHTPISNANGLITYVIGQGNPETGFESGGFENIDWADGPYFLKTEADPGGGMDYSITGTTQFLSVPYALHAGSSSDNQWEQSGNNIFTRNTGNVGIGINNPVNKLEVDGNARFGWESAGYLGLGGDFLGGEIGLFDITGDKILAGKFYSGPASGTYVFGDNLFIRSGNVGIGTQNPQQKLHVAGNAIFASDIGIGRGFIYDEIGMSDLLVDRLIAGKPNAETDLLYQYGGQPGTSEGLFVNSGDVGIGTIEPLRKLTIASNTYRDHLVLFRSSVSSVFGLTPTSNAGGALEIYSADHSHLGAITLMTIASSGNVGIGTINPGQLLDVNGNIRLSGGNRSLGTWSAHNLGLTTNSTTRMTITSSGNVGIGTSSPDASAILELSSTDKGFLPPRMTKTQRDAIASPAEGLVVTCTDCDIAGLQQYTNGSWQALMSGSTGDYGTVVNPTTGKTWLDRNLGASQVAASSTDPDSYGDLYQWGRAADGHQLRTSGTTNTQATTWLAGVPSSWSGSFIISHNNWLNENVTELWSGTAAENNPCPSGFRLPTNAEWNQERLTWTSNNAAGAFASPLKLPVGGYRNIDSGSLINVGSYGYYWSSTVVGTGARHLYFSSGSAGTNSINRANGHSVRCLKD